jgi:hypothetical protein
LSEFEVSLTDLEEALVPKHDRTATLRSIFAVSPPRSDYSLDEYLQVD